MSTYLDIIPSELIQEICLYLNHIDIVKLRKISKIDFNFQYLTSIKFPGFYKIFKIVREESDDYRGFPYEKGHDLIYRVDRYLKQGLKEGDRLDTSIDDRYINIYSDDINYLIDLVNENFLKDELREVILSYVLMQPSNLVQSKLYKYRNEFPNVDIINDIFLGACDEYYYFTRNYTSFEELKNYLENIIPPTWDNSNYYTSMLNLCSYFLTFLEQPETMEIFRDKPLVILSTDKGNNIEGENHENYLVVFNCINEYLVNKLNSK